jgi:hypothetical protein
MPVGNDADSDQDDEGEQAAHEWHVAPFRLNTTPSDEVLHSTVE